MYDLVVDYIIQVIMNNINILLHGSFCTANFGDVLFAELFTNYLESLDPKYNVFVPNASDFVIKNTSVRKVGIIKSFLNAHAVVFASGGYFGEPRSNNHRWNLRFIKRHFPVIILAIIRRLPIAIIGIGVGPLSSSILRYTTKFLFNKAKVITVRDEESKLELINMGVINKINVTTDSALSLLNCEELLKKVPKSSSIERITKKKIIFYHLSSKVENISQAIIEGVNRFLGENQDYKLIVGTDNTSIFLDKNEVSRFFKAKQLEIYKYDSPWTLISILKDSSLIVTSKLHVGILGTMFNKSVVAFPAHPKTVRYYNQLNIIDRCQPIEKVSPAMVYNQLSKYKDIDYKIPNHIIEASIENFVALKKFVESIE